VSTLDTAELRHLTTRLSADLRSGRFEADWDLGKSEYLGESRAKQAAYAALARPVIEAFRARGLVTDEEAGELLELPPDHERLADRLQALTLTLPPG
jgi:hypothetical protein